MNNFESVVDNTTAESTIHQSERNIDVPSLQQNRYNNIIEITKFIHTLDCGIDNIKNRMKKIPKFGNLDIELDFEGCNKCNDVFGIYLLAFIALLFLNFAIVCCTLEERKHRLV
ncbi:hypothetical protein DFJ63DRAFT_314164 [Scheffersomyces coipomensis]|uniref:uncharacterized protein n=1 Tax=Scheffersomyces coipomensis TaxID=1788519 RepID=UPI00315CCACD